MTSLPPLVVVDLLATLLGFGCFALVVWFVVVAIKAALKPAPASHRKPRRAPQPAVDYAAREAGVRQRFEQRGSSGRPPRSRQFTRDHMPPRPAGEPYEPWSPRTRQFEVAGEWYRQDNLRRYFGGAGKLSTEGAEMDSDAQLVPDPMNPYDSNAVAVYVRGWHLGYLEREDALRYHSAIAGIQARGDLATVRSRQWARLGYGGEVSARVTVALPDPEGFDPANNLPEVQHVVLPTGSTIQVTKEDEHMDVLIRCLADYGSESSVAATLHSITEIRPRSAVDAIEVRIDGERVGILTPTQTANLKPLVDFLDERGIIPVSKATLKGNALKADVMLHVVKAQDVDEAWINHFSKINQVPRGATRLRPAFEWDDEDLGQPAQSSISAAPTVAETDAERVSAGWYPVDATTQRYWDGRAWTEHTAPR